MGKGHHFNPLSVLPLSTYSDCPLCDGFRGTLLQGLECLHQLLIFNEPPAGGSPQVHVAFIPAVMQ